MWNANHWTTKEFPTHYFFLFMLLIFSGCTTQLVGVLVPQLGIEPGPPAADVQSFNHWAVREFYT